MKRSILTLSVVAMLALVTTTVRADDEAKSEPTEKPAAESVESAELGTELSVKPTEEGETEAALPLPPKDAAAASGVVDTVKGSMAKEPVMWSIVGLVLAFMGIRSGKGAFTYASAVTSRGEVFGMAILSAGFLGLANGLARAFDWSQLNLSLIAGGVLAMVIGLGFTCQANEDRRKSDQTTN